MYVMCDYEFPICAVNEDVDMLDARASDIYNGYANPVLDESDSDIDLDIMDIKK